MAENFTTEDLGQRKLTVTRAEICGFGDPLEETTRVMRYEMARKIAYIIVQDPRFFSETRDVPLHTRTYTLECVVLTVSEVQELLRKASLYDTEHAEWDMREHKLKTYLVESDSNFGTMVHIVNAENAVEAVQKANTHPKPMAWPGAVAVEIDTETPGVVLCV